MKKRILPVFLTAIMIGSLVGCGSSKSDSTGNEASTESAVEQKTGSEDDPVNLTVFGFKTATEQIPIDELIEEFNKENPDINVTYEGMTNAGGYQDVLTSRLASGQGDDIIIANTNFISELQKSGYLMDLSDLKAAGNYVQDMTVNGEVPGLSMEQSAFGMFVNNDLMKELNLETPQNYDDFIKVCDAVQKAGKTPFIAGASDGTGAALCIEAKGFADMYLNAKNDEETIKAINSGEKKLSDVLKAGFDFATLVRDKKYVDAEKAITQHPLADALQEFAKGDTAFMFMGNWAIADIKKAMPDTDVSFEGFPFNDKPIVMTDAGVRLCINKETEHVEQAKKFVEFMLTTENNDKYVAAQNAFSVLKDGTSTSDPMVTNVAEIIKNGDCFPWSDIRFDTVNAYSFSKQYGQNLWSGSDEDKVISDMEDDIQNTILLK